MSAPIRPCCDLRHHGAVCPDGLVMCQLCFGRYPPDEMRVDDGDGVTWDVCWYCAADEMDARLAAVPDDAVR